MVRQLRIVIDTLSVTRPPSRSWASSMSSGSSTATGSGATTAAPCVTRAIVRTTAGASGDALSLCSPSEKKQLADIEKLIKRPLTVERLVVDAPAVHHDGGGRGRHERSERGGERGDRSAHGHRHTTGSFDRPRHRAQPVDEFFLKPYEPSPSARKAAEDTNVANTSAPQKPQSKQPLAALLGGLGSSWRNKPSSSSSN